MKQVSRFVSILSLLPLVFSPQLSWAQVSKPKAPKKLSKEQMKPVQKINYTEDLQKVFASLGSQQTVGHLFDGLSSGFDHKNKEQLLQTFKKSSQWRAKKLPNVQFTADTVTLKVGKGSKEKTLVMKYVFASNVFATINNQPIYMTDVENPKNLVKRIDAIVNKELDRSQSFKFGFLLNLLLPRAHAGSFGLSIGSGFITQIFSMIMMFKMMKLMTKGFSNSQQGGYHHRHHGQYPPPHYQYQYQYQQRYYGTY